MTTRRKTSVPRLRITQVHSIIGNQERVKRVVTDGLGLGRIGSSVVLVDNSYTRGMIAKAFHIVRFEEVAAEVHAHEAEPSHPAVPEAVEKLVEAAVAPIEKSPHRAKPVEVAVAPIEKAPLREKPVEAAAAPIEKAPHREKPVEAAAAPTERAPRREKPEAATVSPIEKEPRRKKVVADTKAKAKPASAPAKTTRKRTAAKSKE